MYKVVLSFFTLMHVNLQKLSNMTLKVNYLNLLLERSSKFKNKYMNVYTLYKNSKWTDLSSDTLRTFLTKENYKYLLYTLACWLTLLYILWTYQLYISYIMFIKYFFVYISNYVFFIIGMLYSSISLVTRIGFQQTYIIWTNTLFNSTSSVNFKDTNFNTGQLIACRVDASSHHELLNNIKHYYHYVLNKTRTIEIKNHITLQPQSVTPNKIAIHYNYLLLESFFKKSYTNKYSTYPNNISKYILDKSLHLTYPTIHYKPNLHLTNTYFKKLYLMFINQQFNLNSLIDQIKQERWFLKYNIINSKPNLAKNNLNTTLSLMSNTSLTTSPTKNNIWLSNFANNWSDNQLYAMYNSTNHYFMRTLVHNATSQDFFFKKYYYNSSKNIFYRHFFNVTTSESVSVNLFLSKLIENYFTLYNLNFDNNNNTLFNNSFVLNYGGTLEGSKISLDVLNSTNLDLLDIPTSIIWNSYVATPEILYYNIFSLDKQIFFLK